jgi:hypothetical protein
LGLAAFRSYHQDTSDFFALKDAVLRGHHAMETITKAILFAYNPVLLWRKERKVAEFVARFGEYRAGQNAYIVDDEYTIGLSEALQRLEDINALGAFSAQDMYHLKTATTDLEALRNSLQHFAISANPDVVARVLGSAIPRFVDLLDTIGLASDRHFGSGYSILPERYSANLANFRPVVVRFFSEAESVIALMRSDYDELVTGALEALRSRSFEPAGLQIRIRDHGRVGAGPYMPEVDMRGIVELKLNPHDLRLPPGILPGRDVPPVESYDGTVRIAEPQVNDTRNGHVVVTGELLAEATVRLRRLGGILILPACDDHVQILRDAELKLSVNLSYRAQALLASPHYHVERLLESSGRLDLSITAVPRGYAVDDHTHLLRGSLSAPLDLEHAPFSLHAFTEPGGRLEDHHSLDWNVDVSDTFRFL